MQKETKTAWIMLKKDYLSSWSPNITYGEKVNVSDQTAYTDGRRAFYSLVILAYEYSETDMF